MAALNGTLEDLAKELGSKIMDQFKADIGKGWDALRAEIQDVLTETAKDAGRLAVRRIRGEDTTEQEKQIQAQIENLTVAGELLAAKTFCNSVNNVLSAVGSALGTLARAAIKTFLGGLV